MIWQRLSQAAIHGKRAAPVAVFLAIGHHRRIFVKTIQHRFKQRVAVRENFVRRKRLAVLADAVAGFRSQRFHAGIFGLEHQDFRLAVIEPVNLLVREHDHFNRVGRNARGNLQRRRPIGHSRDFVNRVFGVFRHFRVGQHAMLFEIRAEPLDAVGFLPQFKLFLCAIRGCIRRRMAG